MKRKNRVLVVLITLILFLLIYNRSLVYYGLVQARGQLTIIFNTEPVENILGDPAGPDSLKQKIRIIQEAKLFAIKELGLKGEKNYTTFYDQRGKELMWVVTACEPYQLKSYTWDFPVLGSFTYKGFFIPEMADKEAEGLRREGYDASIRNAGGWSTLGILKDPILSGMLDREEGQLAELIIHELTHGTIFIRDDVTFNENLATFIGTEGAELFLAVKYGEHSTELKEYILVVEDREKFSAYVLTGASLLDSLYKTFNPEWPSAIKEKLKSEWFLEFTSRLDTVKFNNPGLYDDYFDSLELDNNFFMSFLRYRGGQKNFKEQLNEKYNGDLAAYIRFLVREYE
ncbi:MAG: aminopeptidase [Cyclobacteriaceae bacterium]|nr:aminopeptidase [Cyclobacteriaceae bacterium]